MSGAGERRRPLLSASVPPEAALVLSAVLAKPEARADVERYVHVLAARGLPRAVVDRALAELEEAARQWREQDVASVSGSTQPSSTEAAAVSSVMELTTQQAADRLGVTPRRVVMLIDAGDLDGRKVGRSWLVDGASVDVLLDARRATA